MATQVLEGTWEEIAKHASRLTGKKLRVTILEDDAKQTQPNEEMLEALRKIKERHKNMPESPGADTLKMIREARSGWMLGNESDE